MPTKLWKGYEQFKANLRVPVVCNVCGKIVATGGLPRHQKTKKCKKCKNHNDKNDAGKSPYNPTSLRDLPPFPGAASLILTKINLRKEFENMTEKIIPKTVKETEAKYECGACGEKFNEKRKFCPGCGVEF